MDLLARSWRGEASLAKAFWIVYVLFGILIALLITLIFSLAMPDFNYMNYQYKIMAIQFPYTLFSAICVWRCAKNSTFIWRILARIIVAIGVIGGIFNIVHAINPPTVVETTKTTTVREQTAT
ncbi:MAG: hypothetical protein H0W64_06390 [Gammaproteobacteria bacterium]|nr:hypothetical protein [Gammaproteobacteria bacterium]